MTAFYISAAALLSIIAVAILLRRKGRTVVDNCVIWVSQDTHCTAIVYYRNGRQIIRFGADVCLALNRSAFLHVDIPSQIYTDDGQMIPSNESADVKQRVSRGLKQLGIGHEFSSPETVAVQSQLR
jgi:hypothetical protein